ncbi:MAG TPA: type II secretion system protein [Planctomycetota bacterium]|nr:type II secretion system protein [Planctomycetota bacterium]
MTSHKKAPSGMTLLEVIFAVSMISIAIMGTFNAWMNSQRLQALQREESIVQAALQRYMNDIRSTPFTRVDNAMGSTYRGGLYVPNPGYEIEPEVWVGDGYSGGGYAGPTDARKKPGMIKLFLGWNGKGEPSDDTLRGVKVSKTPFDGGVLYGNRYWAPQARTPELRIVFINNEVPTEARMGETPENPSDGVDLNGDGQISESPMPLAPANYEFGDIDARPLFPRYLAIPIQSGRAFVDGYQNMTNLIVYPVVLQARWWSVAGLPREITLITFLTNRSGTGL